MMRGEEREMAWLQGGGAARMCVNCWRDHMSDAGAPISYEELCHHLGLPVLQAQGAKQSPAVVCDRFELARGDNQRRIIL